MALLITNIQFTDEKLNRKGAEKDEENMERLLTALGYKVVKHTNQTAKVTKKKREKQDQIYQADVSDAAIEIQLSCVVPQEIRSAIIDFSKDPRLKETDSVVVVIMSHGNLGTVCGVDYKKCSELLSDEEKGLFSINDMYRLLGPEKCPALINKPKIIIIQACRGGDLQLFTSKYVLMSVCLH